MKKWKCVGQFRGYQVYRNKCGHLELWKNIGIQPDANQQGKDITRIITKAHQMDELPQYFKEKKQAKPAYDPYQDANQLKIQ